MAKKVFDIIPPRLVGKKTVKSAKATEHVVLKSVAQKKHHKEKKERGEKSFRFGGLVVSGAGLLILVCIYLYFKLASLLVVVWPMTEDLNIKEAITATATQAEVNLGTKTIPAQLITEERELLQEFDATGAGQNEGKATGTIRVYNKYSPATVITLKTGTHFLSDSGKYFKSATKIVIPAAQIKGSKITPGSVDVKVEAIESGEAYNIASSKFSVPKLAGTNLYYAIYAESNEKMSGGYESETKVVTEDDIDNAKATLSEKLLGDVDAALREKVSSEGFILFNDALTKEVIEASSTVKAGSEIGKFMYKVKVSGSALVFKQSDLNDLARRDIASQIEKGRILLDKSLVLNYTPEKIDLSGNKINFDLQISSRTYPEINKIELISKLSKKDSEQIQGIVSEAFLGQVSQIKVNLWPFWVTKGPSNQNKIKVDLNFE